MYSTEIDGQVLQFGTSGWLYRSNKLMYDKGTNTLWRQFRGEPAVGELVGSGIALEVLPVALTTWSSWEEAHPDTSVLDVRTGVYPVEAYLTDSDNDSAYADYRKSEDTLFPVPQRSTLLPTKSRVFGLVFNGRARAYPQEILEREPVINDALGGADLVIVTPDGGNGSRAFQRAGHTFVGVEPGQGSEVFLLDDEGRRWLLGEDALVQTDDPSTRLLRLPSRSSFWFGWYAFYPGTEVFTLGP